jgi:hypothetical protein
VTRFFYDWRTEIFFGPEPSLRGQRGSGPVSWLPVRHAGRDGVVLRLLVTPCRTPSERLAHENLERCIGAHVGALVERVLVRAMVSACAAERNRKWMYVPGRQIVGGGATDLELPFVVRCVAATAAKRQFVGSCVPPSARAMM